MQTMTIAISTAGIRYFTEQLIKQKALSILQGLKPPADKNIPVPDFISGKRFTKILIKLSSGALQNFKPVYQQISQQAGDTPGQFVLRLAANNFTVSYNWKETFHSETRMCFKASCFWTFPKDEEYNFLYQPSFGALTVNLALAFVYQASTKTYDIQVASTTSSTDNESANIPGNSIVHLQEKDGCFSTKVSKATSDSVSTIDFATPINQLFPPLLKSIPASGQLTDNILYDFDLGDGGLTFPNNSGIAIGVTGNVKYKGTPYSGETPPVLPLPSIPGDAHHLNVYVSSYEINALHWAFYMDGKLGVNLTPNDLGNNAQYLRVNTYSNNIPAFKPYAGAAIYAAIAPTAAPVTVFQQVYEFTPSVMANLESNPNLPNNVKQSLKDSFAGTISLSKDDLETDLQGADIAASYFTIIEAAARMSGMVASQTLKFTLTIQHGADPKPNLIFDVTRVDVMTKLGLGISGNAQTMQFDFMNVPGKTKAAFVSTTVPKFKEENFGDTIWPFVGEPAYAKVMTDMGKTGVPIPIMQGFQFLFEQAELSIQQGYVSILANVELKHQALPMQVRSMLAFAE